MDHQVKKRAKQEMMARVRIVEAILRRWDPMDLAPGAFAPADEYDDYAPRIVSLVVQGCSSEQLLAHLRKLRLGMVCMRDNPQRDRDIAAEIMAALHGEED